MYKPFTKHIFEESLIGKLIDSALVLENGGVTTINFNDNQPDENACLFLKNRFKNIDLAMLNYNAAGPYPSCFDNLTDLFFLISLTIYGTGKTNLLFV